MIAHFARPMSRTLLTGALATAILPSSLIAQDAPKKTPVDAGANGAALPRGDRGALQGHHVHCW